MSYSYMIEEWRTIFYPLGFLSGIVFAIRFIIQWIQSEKQGKSLVTRSFWQLSLLGNILLALHAFIQVQYHVCVIQACNAVISWRNLNLMLTSKKPASLVKVMILMASAIILTSFAFMLQGFVLDLKETWFRIPTTPWQSTFVNTIDPLWHVIGFMGYILFSSRFWIQWWSSERTQTSCLPSSFWWISLGGALLSSFYFMRIHDIVNLIGPLIGLIPYIRNLILIQKSKEVMLK